MDSAKAYLYKRGNLRKLQQHDLLTDVSLKNQNDPTSAVHSITALAQEPPGLQGEHAKRESDVVQSVLKTLSAQNEPQRQIVNNFKYKKPWCLMAVLK